MKTTSHLWRYLLSAVFILICPFVFAQTQDTITIPEVVVTSYPVEHALLKSPSSVSILSKTELVYQQNTSLVAAMNTNAGVRMEERSPGSYRLSLRGSLLRSPFGVRNVKVYVDEFPLTNASGDTYLNLLDKYSIGKIEIMKGPDGSLFGANSEGVVRITPVVFKDSLQVEVNAEGGSYKMAHLQAAAQVVTNNNVTALNLAWQTSDGYRDNSNFERKYFQIANRWKYWPTAQLRALFFYSDLFYRTPGGLTFEQYEQDPTAARPATATFPGAEEQKAGVLNQTFYGGILNDIRFKKHFRHAIALFGSYTDFKNPFITNYETRKELSFGLRTWLEGGIEQKKFNLKINLGLESQRTYAEISNYGNNQGVKDSLQASDELTAWNNFVFTQASLKVLDVLIFEASLSVNLNSVFYSNIYPVRQNEQRNPFDPQLMPRFAISYALKNKMTWRAIVSRGYSVPTLSEIRSSDNIINTALQPESGWNYEVGYRIRSKQSRFWWDVALFYYHMHDAIVTRVNSMGQEYFVNAGGTKQPGIESQLSSDIIKRDKGAIRQLTLANSYTWHQFVFSDYSDEANDYSGNALTGVPRHTVVSGLTVKFPWGFYIFLQHQFTSKLPLNDANSVYADAYNLLQMKAGWEKKVSNKFTLGLFFGTDNLLNERYSLGNDLNAAGGRYYNAAPERNYSGGIRVLFR